LRKKPGLKHLLAMRVHPPEQRRLLLLNHAPGIRAWKSCLEKRQCIICGRTFRGRSVQITQNRDGVIHLGCPGCHSAPHLWVSTEEPLLDEGAWQEWQSALNYFERHEEALAADSSSPFKNYRHQADFPKSRKPDGHHFPAGEKAY
jgi:hypothetical protein